MFPRHFEDFLLHIHKPLIFRKTELAACFSEILKELKLKMTII